MSLEPPIWFDTCKGDKREGCITHPPPARIDVSHLRRFHQSGLMLPSERFDDHRALKEGINNWSAVRTEVFEDNKRKRILARKHKGGVIGIDYPLREGTDLYKKDYERFKEERDKLNTHSTARLEFLTNRKKAQDSIIAPYASCPPAPRGDTDYGFYLQRKTIVDDPHGLIALSKGAKPVKEKKQWTVDRAMQFRKQDVRERKYNIITGDSNELHLYERKN